MTSEDIQNKHKNTNLEQNIKHLEFIQNNIDRMNRCSFQVKCWTMAIISLMITILTTNNLDTYYMKWMPFFAIIPIIIFWWLDAFYLSTERKFIAMYNYLIKKFDSEKNGKSFKSQSSITLLDFEMNLNKFSYKSDKCYKNTRMLNALFSKTVFPIYLFATLVLIVASILAITL